MANNVEQKIKKSGIWIAPAGVTNILLRAKIVDFSAKSIVAGTGPQTLFLTQNGDIRIAGASASGGLGNNGTGGVAGVSRPVQVFTLSDVVHVGSGASFSVALKANGEVWSWGQNVSGQLGDNTIVNKYSPVSVVGGHSFISVHAQGLNAIALKSDGSAWTWGANSSFGALGDNTNIDRSSPVSVVGGHSFVIARCYQNGGGAALKADGSVWTWGNNSSGQLGDNTIVNRSSPVSVVGGHSFVDVSPHNGFMFALKADGSVWTWGQNASGQLGDNTIVNRSSPVQVIGGHSFTKVVSGGVHGIALKSDGSAWAWGSNNVGRLGDNTIVNRSSPVSVVGGHSFVDIGGGASTNFGIKNDGTIWGWGSGSGGALANNTIISRSSPVQVYPITIPETIEYYTNFKTLTQSVTPGASYEVIVTSNSIYFNGVFVGRGDELIISWLI